jgi:hypothetical protein
MYYISSSGTGQSLSAGEAGLLRLLLFAAEQVGLANALGYVGEQLTSDEYDQAEAFLAWCQETGTTFGWNIDEVWMRWKESQSIPPDRPRRSYVSPGQLAEAMGFPARFGQDGARHHSIDQPDEPDRGASPEQCHDFALLLHDALQDTVEWIKESCPREKDQPPGLVVAAEATLQAASHLLAAQKPLGMDVRLLHREAGWLEFHNVTEVHFGYRPGHVAFESDVHGTGATYEVADTAEFKVALAQRLADEF